MGTMKDTNITCNKCGRSFVTGAPKCNFNDSCLTEYPCTMQACIKNKQPDCTAKAVIPSVTVETIDGLTNLANCFVHITHTNTTYYVDDKHRPMFIWAGPVEATLPSDVSTEEQWTEFVKSFDLRSQFLYVKFFSQDTNKDLIDAFYFDKSGKIYFAGEFEEAMEE